MTKLPIKAILVIIIVVLLAGTVILVQRRASLPKSIALSKSDMEVLLGTLPPQTLQELSSNPDEKKNIVSQLKQMLSVGQAAEAAGYADHVDIKPLVTYTHDSVLGNLYQEKNPDAKVSQQDIDSYNKQHGKDFDQFMAAAPGAAQAEGGQKEQMRVKFATMHIYADRARKQGLGKDRESELEIMLGRYQVLAGAYAKDLQNSDKLVTDQDIQNYFNQHSDQFDQVRARHILIKVKKTPNPAEADKDQEPAPDDKSGLSFEEAQKKAQSLLDRIKNGEDFAKLAEQNSDDPGSKVKGGDLGFFSHGQMVQSFDQVAFSLKPGEVSGLVQSQFGIHIIKVEERKKADPSDPKIHQQIIGLLKQQKFQEKINDIINHSKVKIAEDFNIPSKPSTPATMPGSPAAK